jgi:hypothetical protein
MRADLEDEDEDFEKLLAEKQHRELMGTIRSLMDVLQKLESSDTIVTRSIQKHSDKISDLLEKYTPPKAPDVYINQEPVIKELKNLCYEFKELTDVLKNKKPIEWEFKVDRGYGNTIEKITATPK